MAHGLTEEDMERIREFNDALAYARGPELLVPDEDEE